LKNNQLYQTIYDEICKMPVIDTHEHLVMSEADKYAQNLDVLSEYLTRSYMGNELRSAGLSRASLEKVMDPSGDIMQRWLMAEPYWEFCRYIGYGRNLDISVKAIYGFDGINRNTIEPLNAAFVKNRKPGHYRHVIKDICHIETCMVTGLDFSLDLGVPYLKYVLSPMKYLTPNDRQGPVMLSEIERDFSIRVNSLDDWQEAFERELDRTLDTYGVPVFKISSAGYRTLRFDKVGYQTAKEQFSGALENWRRTGGEKGGRRSFPRELEDYMMHYLLGLAGKRNMVMQVHTGMLAGAFGNLPDTNPSNLNNLFLEYPDVDFDLFHIGYPYQNETCALAKMFPNVYIDMCWAHIISPSASVRALDDFLDAAPLNKTMAFGGDYWFVDPIYGHLEISRDNVARSLAGKVENGVFDEGRAVDIARALYYDNPKRLFRI